MPFGILGTWAPVIQLPISAQVKVVGESTEAICFSHSVNVLDKQVGQPGHLGGKHEEPNSDAAILLQLETASESAGDYMCSGAHTGGTGFQGTSGSEVFTSYPIGKPCAGWRSEWVGVELGGVLGG